MEEWKTLARRSLIENKRLTVEAHLVELPDGRRIDDWLWVIVPDYVNVLPVTPEGKFLVFRQQKYAANGLTLALVGGIIEQGEDPLDAARRELREEMGYLADEWIPLGHYATDANRGVGTGHLYLARNATVVGKTLSDELEDQELLLLTKEELRAALLAGKFQVMSWSAAIGLALAKLSEM